ncbi:MAG TPA: signal peptidase II [Propionicimonas sp.]|nr:signal peptidase II [Propionicimonas sp.]
MRHLQAAGGTAITGAHAIATRVAPYRWLCLGIGLAGFVLDLVVKNAVIANLDPQHPIPLLGGLVTLQLIRNPGAAFSMGENFTVLLTIIAIAALIAVLVFIVPRLRHVGWAVAIGCLLAGIAGNLTDRLFREPAPFHGHVVDFIQLPNFAIFNVADMFITSAAVIGIWLSMITQVSFDGARLKETVKASDV